MIDLGGQISVGGAPPKLQAWPVSIAHPLDRTKPAADVWLAGGSLSTSAGSERDLTVEGRRVGHILDPRTGRPASFQGSTTVWHESGLIADILSTALFVMGPDEGLRWAETRNIAVCFLEVDASGALRSLSSKAFLPLQRPSQVEDLVP
jgi:thiamine biosynthesis lipoprotein